MSGYETTLDNYREQQLKKLISSLNMQYDQWDELNNSRAQFFKENKDPKQLPFIRDVVSESWIRTKRYGLSPDTPISNKMALKSSLLEKVLKDNRRFLETVLPLLHETLLLLNKTTPFSVGILDRNAIMLFLHNFPLRKISKPGMVLSEEKVGTSAHSICLETGEPAFIIGPEIYNQVLQYSKLVCAVPIHNDNGEVIAAFVAPYYKSFKYTKEEKEFLSRLVTWQFLTAKRLEDAVRQNNHNFIISIDNSFLNTAMSLVNEGIVLINRNGMIERVSIGGEKIIGLNNDQAKGRHYSDIIGDIPLISKSVDGTLRIPRSASDVVIRKGKKNYLLKIKPISNYEPATTDGAVIHISELRSSNDAGQRVDELQAIYTFEDIYGDSAEIVKTKHIAKKIAPNLGSVLLTGESGTGKELFAHAIHKEYRPYSPFVAINCAAIPKGLIESELFGYEGGSFTGAERKGRAGKIELVNGGTLFLDEIGDMPLELQPVLLRVLEDKRVMRVGGSKYIPVNFRIIAATNKDLYEVVKRKEFREDFYFRLAAFKIAIPPLRNRGTDIIHLAQYFVAKYCAQLNRPVLEMEPEVYGKLLEYPWPGNVRELKNCVLWAVSMAEEKIRLDDLPEEIKNGSSDGSSGLPRSIQEIEKQAIQETMAYCKNNVCDASKILGMARPTLYRKLKDIGFHKGKQ